MCRERDTERASAIYIYIPATTVLCGLLRQHVTLALAARPDQPVMITKAVKHFLRWNSINLKNPGCNIFAAEHGIQQEPLQLLEICLAPGLLEVLAQVVVLASI